MEDQFVDLLINKYLKSLDIDWFRDYPWKKVTSIIAEIGSNIEEIFFREFSEETLFDDIICNLPKLKKLTYWNGYNAVNLKYVAKFCPDIEEIHLGDCTVTFEAVEDLCTDESGKALCTKLKKMWISNTCNITEESIQHLLRNLPSLEFFDYQQLPLMLYALHERDMSSLDTISYNINTLDLMQCADSPHYVDVLKVCLSVCPHLKSLSLSLVKGDEFDIHYNLSDLEFLNIDNISGSEININGFFKCTGGKLTSLSLDNCQVSVSVIAENCPLVKEFSLIGAHLLSGDDSKAAFNSLSSCSFINTNVLEYVKTIDLLLSSTNNLESLTFKSCNLLSTEIEALILKYCKLYPIKKISFWRCRTDKNFVKDVLSSCKSLRYLDIDECFRIEKNFELFEFAETLCNKPTVIASCDPVEDNIPVELEDVDEELPDYYLMKYNSYEETDN